MTVLCSGTATGFASAALAAADGPAEVLGSFPTACYLRLASGTVVALLSRDAVQLPIGVTLPWSSAELPLDAPAGPSSVAGGELWLGRLRVTVTGRRDPALAHCGRPVQLPGQPAGPDRLGPDPVELDMFGVGPFGVGPSRVGPVEVGPFGLGPFSLAPAEAVAWLLGRGPGLTPAGDDLLCGALAAQVLFGLPDTGLAAAVTARLTAPGATTALSRQLLLRAVAGDGLPELQEAGRAICRPEPDPLRRAWARLLRIGHSSGAALAAGLLAGARHARERVAV
ncbi:MAG TPA: DUF2877 domain-containing protein [Jatrophihabitans sp.]|nr:DUF2877 domain-containing protein [Jatrophihabitans sp.]